MEEALCKSRGSAAKREARQFQVSFILGSMNTHQSGLSLSVNKSMKNLHLSSNDRKFNSRLPLAVVLNIIYVAS